MSRALVNWLINRAMRTPYFHLYHEDDSLYMRRFWLVPFHTTADKEPGCYVAKWWRNPLVWLLQRFDIAIRVHHICTPDLDRAMHDHPWDFVSVVLRGWYAEARPLYPDGFETCIPGEELRRLTYRNSGSIAYRRATDRHRITMVSEGGVWTLFITGRKRQGWGFYTAKGKVPYNEYESVHNKKPVEEVAQ